VAAGRDTAAAYIRWSANRHFKGVESDGIRGRICTETAGSGGRESPRIYLACGTTCTEYDLSWGKPARFAPGPKRPNLRRTILVWLARMGQPATRTFENREFLGAGMPSSPGTGSWA
jgi:hypothetical protein